MRMKRKSNHGIFSSGFEGLVLLLYFILSLFLMEMVLRLHTAEKFFSIGILYSLLFAISLSAVIYIMVTFFKEKQRNLLSSFALVLMGITFWSQLYTLSFSKLFTPYFQPERVEWFLNL